MIAFRNATINCSVLTLAASSTLVAGVLPRSEAPDRGFAKFFVAKARARATTEKKKQVTVFSPKQFY